MLKRHRGESVVLDLSVVSYLDLSATEAIVKELANRNTEETFFVIQLRSPRLQAHFEERMAGLPVQFTLQAPA